mmetsp:Transcript_22791/g.21929  ORF Transcript_22791/g.21929 Transcript_22791/m.21929 type:complete len:151 (-) Transcript_22791:94-546(-)
MFHKNCNTFLSFLTLLTLCATLSFAECHSGLCKNGGVVCIEDSTTQEVHRGCNCPDGFYGHYCEFTSSSNWQRILQESSGSGNKGVQATLFFFIMALLCCAIVSLLRLYCSTKKEAESEYNSKKDICEQDSDDADSNQMSLELPQTPEIV